jgi:hypothetical protein
MKVQLFKNRFVSSIVDLDSCLEEMQAEIFNLQNHSALQSKQKEVISAPTSQNLSSFGNFF